MGLRGILRVRRSEAEDNFPQFTVGHVEASRLFMFRLLVPRRMAAAEGF